METTVTWAGRVVALLIAASLAAGSALADPPEGKGKGKSKNSERNERSEHRQDNARRDDHGNYERNREAHNTGGHFASQQRVYIREYYVQEYHRGSCPPGLAKKHNGCMPPGQAKKWQVGRPIPRDVVFYDLPPTLVVQLGAPPAGHRYVRAAADILLIAVGTGMVVDAIEDLGRM